MGNSSDVTRAFFLCSLLSLGVYRYYWPQSWPAAWPHWSTQFVFCIFWITNVFACMMDVSVSLLFLSFHPPLPSLIPTLSRRVSPPYKSGPAQGFLVLEGSFYCHCWLFGGRALDFREAPRDNLDCNTRCKNKTELKRMSVRANIFRKTAHVIFFFFWWHQPFT